MEGRGQDLGFVIPAENLAFVLGGSFFCSTRNSTDLQFYGLDPLTNGQLP